jgi:arylsulfatase A-like enzyme
MKFKVILTAIIVLSLTVSLYFIFWHRQQKPNIIFITVDTLRADRLAVYGYESIETPHIDSLAEGGVLFSQAVAQVPITLPSHSSIFTGLNPTTHNVRENGTFRLGDAEVTLAEVLKEHGYATAAFIGGFPLDSRFGLNQGFDFYDDDLSTGNTGEVMWQGHQVGSFERRANDVVNSALKWIYDNREKKFFTWIHLYDPHEKYSPPETFREKYKDNLYDGEVAYVDHTIGKFFKIIRQWGMLKDVLIVFTSDHGESLGEHRYWGHGRRLYEQGLRIPLIMSYPPFLPEGRTVNSLVRSIDIVPTLLSMLNIKTSDKIEGVSLLPYILQQGNENMPLTSYGETLMSKLRGGEEELRSFRTEKWKYIRYTKENRTTFEELYNLQDDPEELDNLAMTEKSEMNELSSQLNTFMTAEGAEGTSIPMDKETEEKLKSLGYIQ